ncbi:hypothetical protein PsYK624_020780 [Phanerochaete sordida]|uniref:SAP domain-containing protein n=1 Tax=Phanerochaete sordida TaxID=48140 RepID=A0A9P3FZA4_9APHY|nr:hypothetical protein PsYK624_020780 [Phanerochaete sordida]
MAALPDRKTLESMRRADLQKLCKDRGLRANMKSEALIDLLIETSKPEYPPPAHKRSSSMRIVSRSRPGTSTGIRNRVGSMIIHDTPETQDEPMDEDLPDSQNPEAGPVAQNGAAALPVQQAVGYPSGPTTRTRKAVESHRKIGLGRPRALQGGSLRAGARNTSSNIPKRTRGGSKNIPPSQLPIREESEEQTPQAGPSGTKHDAPTVRSSPLTEVPSRSSGENVIKSREHSAVLIQPPQVQIAEMQAELKRLASKVADVDGLRHAVNDLRAEVAALRSQSMVDELEAQVRTLQEEIATLRGTPLAGPSGTSIPSSGSQPLPSTSTSIPGPSDENETPSYLGKRARALEDGDRVAGVIEAGQEAGMSAEVLQTQVIRPPRKRGKLAEKEPSPETLARRRNPEAMEEVDEAELPPRIPHIPRGPAFTVFSGPEEPPEQTPSNSQSGSQTRTPAYGATPSVPTSTANAAENQAPSTGNNAFAFNFATSIFQQPETSTPAVAAAAPMPMPALEAPTSPTPAYVERNGRRERNDPFHPLGPPRRPPSQASRPASRAAAAPSTSSDAQRSGEATVSPAALQRAPPLPSLPEEPRSTAEGQTAHPPAPAPPTGRGAGSSSSRSTPPPSLPGAPWPATLLPAGPLRTGGSTARALGLAPLPCAPETPAMPVRRTLYGTERDMDTRFGDFGLEGVASMGFWSAAPGAL